MVHLFKINILAIFAVGINNLMNYEKITITFFARDVLGAWGQCADFTGAVANRE